jgi:2-dehydro-3-deoxyglucarate aldolase
MINLKEKLCNNELTIGSWITIGHPAVAEILANAGFEWLVIDIEHTTIDLSMVQMMITTIQSCGATALVRVSKNEEVVIKRVLDAGADGIIVPMVCSAADARQAVDYAKYPPTGKRGVGIARAQKYSTNIDFYKEWIENNLVIIAQIEHIEGIRNLDAILDVEGIDGTIIGPYDLSGSLGMPGDFDRAEMVEALDRFKKTCKANNFSMGFHVVDTDLKKIQKKINEGYRFIAYGTDFLFMSDHAKQGLKEIFSLTQL